MTVMSATDSFAQRRDKQDMPPWRRPPTSYHIRSTITNLFQSHPVRRTLVGSHRESCAALASVRNPKSHDC